MNYKYLCTIESGQDGAIYGDYLFRFDTVGVCNVYSVSGRNKLSSFTLDQINILKPHSNAVCFGTEFYEKTDEFPLLYSNIYNNYAKATDRMEGTCCVYRIQRDGNWFKSKLVQVIRVGFVENTDYWKSHGDVVDVRPYGNFVVDIDHNKLYAFTMRDCDHVTRYFAFDLPEVSEGVYSDVYGANVVTLTVKDIKTWFDCEYSNYIQGACYHDNKLYSVEGFSDATNPAKLQVIDLINQKQLASVDLYGMGLDIEPEFVAFHEGGLYYSDAAGKLFMFTFCC